ncbi:putative HVA22-like protein g [Lycium barbarum]|uniref:putative HVA22-like protein g n=1 Tax=Lycium barbarum TaxID=112863 RepID=UPI00293F153F|nr:putative HVA22-like protein g [Lycium barbarum]
MIGSFITRGLVMVFGYAYPAYECFKTVEMNKPDIQQLRFWCQYWILIAMMTVCERFGDAFISWVPMYSEAKLAFIIYLWCPKTKGTTYVYDAFFRPVILRHEPEIDKNLLELRIRAGDMFFLYWQKAASYGQTRVFDVLQYIASQSNPPPPTQPQRQSSRGRQPTATLNRRSSAPRQEQASPASSESSSEDEADTTEEAESSKGPPPASTAAANAQKATPSKSLVSTASAFLNTQKASPSKAPAETTESSTSVETRAMEIDSVPSSANESVNAPAEEAAPVTRARPRKGRTTNNP